jgi:hypothetical protein
VNSMSEVAHSIKASTSRRLNASFARLAISTFASDIAYSRPTGFEGLLPGEKEANLAREAVAELRADYADCLADRYTRLLDAPSHLREGHDASPRVTYLVDLPTPVVKVVRKGGNQLASPVMATVDGVLKPLGNRIPDAVRWGKSPQSLDPAEVKASRDLRTTSTFSCDIAYSLRPTALRASGLVWYSRHSTICPSSHFMT